jgi:hypothetical protein
MTFFFLFGRNFSYLGTISEKKEGQGASNVRHAPIAAAWLPL